MKPLPRYWARREDRVTVPTYLGPAVWDLTTYGSSHVSQADAQREADERFAAFMDAGGDVHRDWYYPLRHAPEEILREVRDGEELIGVVTRNRYGVEVLNTDALLIADVDLPEPVPSRKDRARAERPDRGTGSGGNGDAGRGAGVGGDGGSLLSRLFGRRAADPGPDLSGAAPDLSGPGSGGSTYAAAGGVDAGRANGASGAGLPADDPAAAAMIARIEDVARTRPELGFSTYRTRAGLRVLVTGLGAAPASTGARELLEAMGSDPLYVTLCRVQETYRARLTPKPWRVGSYALHQALTGPRVPVQPAPAGWLEEYERLSEEFAVCRLVSRTGPAPTPREQILLDLHDQAVGIDRADSLPLA